jgi:hypothetical protein
MFIFVLVMDIVYLRREIELSALLGEELPSDVKELIKFFKSLTFRYEKDSEGVETWYDENDQWTVEICEEKWKYLRFYYKNWYFLERKYGLKSTQISDLVKGMLEVTLNRKVSTPEMQLGF